MDLEHYFESIKGTGILATADKHGKPAIAIYAAPHFMKDGTIALIMTERLSHANILENPYAAYMFIEKGEPYKGKRLYIRMIREEQNTELLHSLHRRHHAKENPKTLYLVFFEIEKTLPLAGSVSDEEK